MSRHYLDLDDFFVVRSQHSTHTHTHRNHFARVYVRVTWNFPRVYAGTRLSPEEDDGMRESVGYNIICYKDEEKTYTS